MLVLKAAGILGHATVYHDVPKRCAKQIEKDLWQFLVAVRIKVLSLLACSQPAFLTRLLWLYSL
ncbi:MAG: hypothetical protein ACR2LR_23225 [Hassallia sp.]